MIDGRGRTRITDFGIAAIAREVRGADMLGTPAYVAPEQLAGRDATRRRTADVVYLALEPCIRRRWLHVLIGWNRALAGPLRDPLVGRAVLAGIALAAVYSGRCWSASRFFRRRPRS